ncbi:MAG: class I SAM-dependent methyltransferase [Herbiconiux sp.]|nr:class I SAM-dependent methyltransferase [Herbiconiux sp.]
MTSGAVSFATYADALESGADIPASLRTADGRDLTPYQVLRMLVPRHELRQRGTFFTSTDMASGLWRSALESVEDNAIVVDPACGAGDLLLPMALHAASSGLNVTIRACDIDPHFTQIARSRLEKVLDGGGGLVEGQVRDFTTDTDALSDATHVVLNPPFVPMVVETDWASGAVNAASWFVIRALGAMKPGSRLLAVLPDVLRSGSRYEAWRAAVQRLGKVTSVQALGVFDTDTDVHVFTLDVIAGDTGASVGWVESKVSEFTLGDLVDVRVGPVVPHRDPEIGALVEFITARSLSAGVVQQRRYSGRLEIGPMVLVNRTSRPGETPRVRARFRESQTATAIENHLLVVIPKDPVATPFAELLRVLQSPSTAHFLDSRIRCRHLTVKALKEIPWDDNA